MIVPVLDNHRFNHGGAVCIFVSYPLYVRVYRPLERFLSCDFFHLNHEASVLWALDLNHPIGTGIRIAHSELKYSDQGNKQNCYKNKIRWLHFRYLFSTRFSKFFQPNFPGGGQRIVLDDDAQDYFKTLQTRYNPLLQGKTNSSIFRAAGASLQSSTTFAPFSSNYIALPLTFPI